MDGSLHARIASARHVLVQAGLPPEDSALDAEVLARHVLEWDRTALLTRANESPPPDFDDRFFPLVARRANHEPIAYITGHREFWGLEFEVTPDVLIPRPETEILIEEALDVARCTPPRLVVDVGTGSGCIAVSLAHELASARFVATDVSNAALNIARRNATTHAVDQRIEFLQCDLLTGILEQADLIVSNPPYVANGSRGSLPPEVVQFEPHAALFAGDDGLAVYKRLLHEGARVLADDGRMIVELGYDQQLAVAALADQHGWLVERVRPDLQGIPRAAVLKKVGTHG